MTTVEILGIVLAVVALAFAFETPRKWFLRIVRLERGSASGAPVAPQDPAAAPVQKDKLVTSAWWEASDLRKQYESKGFNHFQWSNAERVPELEQQGHEVVYLAGDTANTVFRIVNKSGQVLTAKRDG